MPAIASLVINDGQATPVAHTFAPARITADNGKVIALFEDRVSGILVGYWRLRSEVSPVNSNKMYKLRFIIERATLETLSNNTSSGINPAPTLAYYTTAALEIWAHQRSTVAERKDARTLMANMLANANIQAVIDNIEAFY